MNTIDSIWVSSTESKLSDLSSAVDSLQCQLNTLQAKNDILTKGSGDGSLIRLL